MRYHEVVRESPWTSSTHELRLLRAQARGRLKTATTARRLQRLAWFTLLVSVPLLFLAAASEHATWYMMPLLASLLMAGLASSVQDLSRRDAWRATLQAHLLSNGSLR